MRKIIHIDMDAFYASVEQRDDPTLRGKPVVVGGKPNTRSVVAAASYEARKFGIRSAMPSDQAKKLCPHAVFLPPRFEAYRAVSEQIMEIFLQHTELVEPLSLDEAYLDVTDSENPSATRIAEKIRAQIFERTSLTASAGVAPNKFLAKIASDLHKPNGLTVIPPDRIEAVLPGLSIRAIPGVGRVTEERMKGLGIHTVSDLRRFSLEALTAEFGKIGGYFFRAALGEDDRPVRPRRERKSIGAEDTFSGDITNLEQLFDELEKLASKVWTRLRTVRGRTVTVKVTYAGFSRCTRSRTLPQKLQSEAELLKHACDLLQLTEAGTTAVRLLGIAVSHFDEETPIALPAERDSRQLTFSFMRENGY